MRQSPLVNAAAAHDKDTGTVGHAEVDVDTDAEVEPCAPGGSQSTAKKRGRSANWLPCEVVAAFLARQYIRSGSCSMRRLKSRRSAFRTTWKFYFALASVSYIVLLASLSPTRRATLAPRLTARNKTCWPIMVTVSSGVEDLFHNWMYWYNRLKPCHRLYVHAEDSRIHRSLQVIYDNHNFVLLSSEEDLHTNRGLRYGTIEYKSLMSRRPRDVMNVMKRFNLTKILFTDVDTVWLSDPAPFLLPGYDMIASVDAFTHQTPYFCGGFVAYMSTERTWELLQAWSKELQIQPQHNQPVLNKFIAQGRVQILALPSAQFPSGRLYFHQQRKDHAVVVHANFLQGTEAKTQELKRSLLWHVPGRYDHGKINNG
mmetsp:Transcript_2149/g.7152  ORF Transcript_2149/g.7152 Transcript_2149/m.7152 type:complete len:370 (+) Transcript_2149:191-1300(+)|eukprot:CAMPEP_0179692712 /NCGR_PEP_ID=MMETSP0936-20121108/4885_1 /TAXON_ID=548131 ORGANISM="Ostreococcus mediterraneus, Strain clade-D-RCC2573" /NCGR_SAMPLE_ID=MMETSP0936 /ASSEMBLY_ACC=CAM_ASM_000574 /LENGTH=369 /DNA_ID=CAMNT_0021565423 /DNA_START=457 /DNA_END=1566 /DNA_ORIENTATION=-